MSNRAIKEQNIKRNEAFICFKIHETSFTKKGKLIILKNQNVT